MTKIDQSKKTWSNNNIKPLVHKSPRAFSFLINYDIIEAMKLDELKKKLYKPESEFEKRLEIPKSFQIEQEREKKAPEEWQKIEKKQLSPKQKKRLLIGGILVIAVFLIVAGFMIWQGFTSFDKDKVEVKIKGPERIVGGEEVQFTVEYKNKTRLALENIQLIVHYPENSIVNGEQKSVETINLPRLNIEEENKVELPVRIVGLKEETKKVWVELIYQPFNLSSKYTNKVEFSTMIVSVPLVLDFDLPERLVDNQSFNFSLRYLNQADVSFNDLQIRIEYPDGFSFESAQPSPIKEDKTWPIFNLISNEQGKIFIRGSIHGEKGTTKSFKAQLGILKDDQFISYTETVSGVSISSSPLLISQTVNNSTEYIAQVGEKLTYLIDYQNTTDIGIKNVIITSQLNGKALDLSSLELGKGSFNGSNQIITWNASNLSDLEYLGPGQQGQIAFSVNIKNPLPVNNYTDKNFTVENKVRIDSSEKPLSLAGIDIAGESQSITKITSQLTIQAQAYYYDDLITNSGPIPPKVGQTTTYTIKWRLVNSSNDLSQVKVEASLPPHVKWNNKISPINTNLKYNSQTGKVIWTVDDLPAATGVLLPVKEIAFQISITPSLANLDSLVELIGQSQVSGQDNFVELKLTSKDSLIDTGLPDDLNVGDHTGTVIE